MRNCARGGAWLARSCLARLRGSCCTLRGCSAWLCMVARYGCALPPFAPCALFPLGLGLARLGALPLHVWGFGWIGQGARLGAFGLAVALGAWLLPLALGCAWLWLAGLGASVPCRIGTQKPRRIRAGLAGLGSVGLALPRLGLAVPLLPACLPVAGT